MEKDKIPTVEELVREIKILGDLSSKIAEEADEHALHLRNINELTRTYHDCLTKYAEKGDNSILEEGLISPLLAYFNSEEGRKYLEKYHVGTRDEMVKELEILRGAAVQFHSHETRETIDALLEKVNTELVQLSLFMINSGMETIKNQIMDYMEQCPSTGFFELKVQKP